jgi:hypothetical protein
MTDPMDAEVTRLQEQLLAALTENDRLKRELHDLRRQRQSAFDGLESMRDSMVEGQAEAERDHALYLEAEGHTYIVGHKDGIRDTLRIQAHILTKMLLQPEFREIS